MLGDWRLANPAPEVSAVRYRRVGVTVSNPAAAKKVPGCRIRTQAHEVPAVRNLFRASGRVVTDNNNNVFF